MTMRPEKEEKAGVGARSRRSEYEVGGGRSIVDTYRGKKGVIFPLYPFIAFHWLTDTGLFSTQLLYTIYEFIYLF